MKPIHQLAKKLGKGKEAPAPAKASPSRLRPTRATVLAINSDGTLNVNLDGDVTATVVADCFTSVRPSVGDVVDVLCWGGRVVAFGEVATNPMGPFTSGGQISGTYGGEPLIHQIILVSGTMSGAGRIAVSFPSAFPHSLLFIGSMLQENSGALLTAAVEVASESLSGFTATFFSGTSTRTGTVTGWPFYAIGS